MPDTPSDWRVILRQLEDTIGVVKHEHGVLQDIMGEVGSEFSAVQDSWDTPATSTFTEYHQWFTAASGDLSGLLEDAIRRLQQVHDNYRAAEDANQKNLIAHKHPPGQGGGQSNGSGNKGPGSDPGSGRKHQALDTARKLLRDGPDKNG